MSPTLTTLPLELRNEIYSHVFNYEDIVVNDRHLLLYKTSNLYDHDFFTKFDPQRILALLYINHQVSDEAAAYFYAKTNFCGQWPEIASFVKGIGARRRDLIRSVHISQPSGIKSLFNGDIIVELLSGLPNLRKVCILTSGSDFTPLQNELVQGGISKTAEKWDTEIHNLRFGTKRCDSPTIFQGYTDKYVWRYVRVSAQWTGGERVRTITGHYPLNDHFPPAQLIRQPLVLRV